MQFDLYNRIPQGVFGLSFLSWQGNKVPFEKSQWLSILLIVVAFVVLISFFFLRSQLAGFYQRKEKQVLLGFQIFSGFIICLTIFRAIILAVGNYPNLWEIIPLHFCRMFIVVMSSSLLFKKINIIKYIGFFAILGAIFGLLLTDLKNSQFWMDKGGVAIGYDSYIFWDFLIIHISSLLIPGYFLTVNQFEYSKRDVALTGMGLTIFTIVIFGLDWGFSRINDPRWNANWFYLAPNKFNSVYKMLSAIVGPLASWPFTLFLFIALGMILYTLCFVIYFWLNKFEFIFDKQHKKIRFINQKATLWQHFKDSKLFVPMSTKQQ